MGSGHGLLLRLPTSRRAPDGQEERIRSKPTPRAGGRGQGRQAAADDGTDHVETLEDRSLPERRGHRRGDDRRRATVFHTKRGNNCVFDSLLDFSRIICPRVMMYVSF